MRVDQRKMAKAELPSAPSIAGQLSLFELEPNVNEPVEQSQHLGAARNNKGKSSRLSLGVPSRRAH